MSSYVVTGSTAGWAVDELLPRSFNTEWLSYRSTQYWSFRCAT